MRVLDKFIFVILFFSLLFISLNRHSRHANFNYHSQLFADKAGYHIYFPAYFYYAMDPKNLPDSIINKTGQGFSIKNDKIITKYPIGVAICQFPFSSIAAIADYFLDNHTNRGFTNYHHIALNWATAVWGSIGLLLIFLSAIRFWGFSYGQSYMLIFGILFLSNLLYYTTRDCGMSHAYSFTVFAGIQYLIYGCIKKQTIQNKDVFVGFILGSLLIVLRPLNGVFVIFPLSYIIASNWIIIKKITLDVANRNWLVGTMLAAFPIGLQLAYNYYAYGKPFADGYENESFNNIKRIDLIKLWFSPNNGALLYSPILILVFISIFQAWKTDTFIRVYFIYFLVISVTYASWWSPELGCGFGHRGFTEHLAFFALPIGMYIHKMSGITTRVIQASMVIGGILLFLCQWNFDGCWQAQSDWDWTAYVDFFTLKIVF